MTCIRCYSTKPVLSTIQLIKKLREEIHAPLNIVKAAVSKASPAGDYDAALSILKKEMTKRGEKIAAKASDRVTAEGWVITARSSDGKSASISVLNCETDFVAKSDEIMQLATQIGSELAEQAPDHPIGTHVSKTADEVDALTINGESVASKLTNSTSIFGESIKVASALTTRLAASAPRSVLGIYCHGGPSISKDVYLGRMGALLNISAESTDIAKIADELAREVVAQDPETIEELWTLEKIGDAKNRTVRQWAGNDVAIEAWTRLNRAA